MASATADTQACHRHAPSLLAVLRVTLSRAIDVNQHYKWRMGQVGAGLMV